VVSTKQSAAAAIYPEADASVRYYEAVAGFIVEMETLGLRALRLE
jgi:hypothetical protein